jgi:membrane protease YdiL (CAAX protease family)
MFTRIFDAGPGLLAAIGVGLPVAVATSALNKAIETAALLRLGVRTRGAVLGVLSWIGYVAMLLPFLTLSVGGGGGSLRQAGAWLAPWFPAWPVRMLLFGWGDTSNLSQVILSWLMVAAMLGLLALGITHRATSHGIEAASGASGPGETPLLSTGSRLGRDPLRRKELLWLVRDRSAIVQVVLVPLTIAASQAVNFRGLYHLTTTSWSALCGLAIICGTYFLLVLGPRSLASEGAALWLALTWPRGLEDLLKAKARLWGNVANSVVGVVLVIACIIFPGAWWKIALVGCGWLLFSSMLALKAVALVTVSSSSGEPEPPNQGRRFIALIGTLAFGTGVVTQSWHLAVIGVVFSSLVSVAMWQNLRARLPFLFDPWSEQPVPAPSLLQATVGIALLVECIGVLTALAAGIGGPSSLWLARAIGYGLAGAVGCIAMQNFLSRRGVGLKDIVVWEGETPRLNLPAGLALGVAGGIGLGLGAAGYVALIRLIPAAREALDQAAKISASFAGQEHWILLMAVGFAPVAEEYFFRGLLFRTLDRELGDWRALVLSAAFFAIFHPPLAWGIVAVVGIFNAWLFKKTRNLVPSIICHAAYNTVVLLLPHHP